MNCDLVVESIPVYCYGELPPEEEEKLEHHVQGCSACRRELERYKALAAALDSREVDLPPALLSECRHDLTRAVYRSQAPAALRGAGAWSGFRDGFRALFASFSRYRQPIGAVALIALGYFSARLTTSPQGAGPGAPASDIIYSAVHSIQPDPSGQVRISLDETRRRVVSGNLDDKHILRLLLAAAKEEDNPAVRVESVGMLQSQPGGDVRDMLLNRALHDSSAAVRLKAIDGLKPFEADPQVRRTLAEVLLNDANPGVRIRTIDMLVEHQDGSMVGVLQDVVQRESNSYVRLKCERALRAMNASVGTF
jgi:hypothetical protein